MANQTTTLTHNYVRLYTRNLTCKLPAWLFLFWHSTWATHKCYQHTHTWGTHTHVTDIHINLPTLKLLFWHSTWANATCASAAPACLFMTALCLDSPTPRRASADCGYKDVKCTRGSTMHACKHNARMEAPCMHASKMHACKHNARMEAKCTHASKMHAWNNARMQAQCTHGTMHACKHNARMEAQCTHGSTMHMCVVLFLLVCMWFCCSSPTPGWASTGGGQMLCGIGVCVCACVCTRLHVVVYVEAAYCRGYDKVRKLYECSPTHQ
jgi:hypothetical protein